MWKWYSLTTSFSLFFTLVTNSATFSVPLSSSSQYPKVENSQVYLPLCYMQLADGIVLNLQKVCDKNSPIKSTLGKRIAKDQFRRGTGNAYATDSQ